MARRKGLLQAIAQAQREAERQRIAQQRAATQAARAAEQARRAYERLAEAERRMNYQLYVESRTTAVALQNERLEQTVAQLSTLLSDTLSVDDFLDLETLKQTPDIPVFAPGALGIPKVPPKQEAYMPAPLTTLQKLVPGAKKKYDQAVAEALERFQKDLAAHTTREQEREKALAAAKEGYSREVEEIRSRIAAQNAEIEQLQRDLAAGTPDSITGYCLLVLEASTYPEGFPQKAKLAYVPESKQLVIEYDLPDFGIIPEVGTYKYIKAKDEVTQTVRPMSQRKALYASVVAQVALRTLHELYEADRQGFLDTIVFNGYVDTIDKSTGRGARICLVTVRTTHDVFAQLDLSRVDPATCLKGLNASISKNPAEMSPVRPVLEFSMVDPRFIQETDILSGLDQRPNLMELTPSEFESLIANLFQKMGLETRLTQASRDGGVDCVAFDPRPIFGGKVVIQAKRYKHTVGVSAVRDLYGTVQNEGASKGILVTTSGYGKAAFDFAQGKPLELLSGSNLLYLLAEHAGIEAKIEVPENWRDPQPDSAPVEEVGR